MKLHFTAVDVKQPAIFTLNRTDAAVFSVKVTTLSEKDLAIMNLPNGVRSRVGGWRDVARFQVGKWKDGKRRRTVKTKLLNTFERVAGWLAG